MNMTAKAQKWGLASRRHHKMLSAAKSMQMAKALQARAEPAATQVEFKSEAQLTAERLAMHRKAVSMIAGMWKDHDGAPIDGVEYQNKMREAR